MIARALAGLVLFTAAGWAADASLLSLVMPEAVSLAGVNATEVKGSPFGQYLLRQATGVDTGAVDFMTATGFDTRRDVQEVLVASAQPLRPTLQPASGLVLVRGIFDVARITQAALTHKATLTQYDGVPILTGPEGKGAVAFPDGTLAIAGTPADVRAALDRRSSPMPMNADLSAAAQSLSAAQDVWAVSRGPLVPPDLASPAMALFSKVEQTSWGLKFGGDVRLSAQATLPTAQDAGALAQALQFLAGMSDLYVKDRYFPACLLKNLQVTADGNLAHASIAVPEATLEQLFSARPGAAAVR